METFAAWVAESPAFRRRTGCPDSGCRFSHGRRPYGLRLVVFLKETGDSPRPAMKAGGRAFPVDFRVMLRNVDAAVPREGGDMPDVQLRNEIRPLRLGLRK